MKETFIIAVVALVVITFCVSLSDRDMELADMPCRVWSDVFLGVGPVGAIPFWLLSRHYLCPDKKAEGQTADRAGTVCSDCGDTNQAGMTSRL